MGSKITILAPKRAILGNRGHKMDRRAAEGAPTGKPKVSRVTSGHGEDKISLSGVCQRPKKMSYEGEAKKKQIFRSKIQYFGPKIRF